MYEVYMYVFTTKLVLILKTLTGEEKLNRIFITAENAKNAEKTVPHLSVQASHSAVWIKGFNPHEDGIGNLWI